MGRKKNWDERLLLTLPEGAKALIDSVLAIGENRNAMIRSAIDAEIRKRTRRLARSSSETAPEDDQTED